VLYYTGKLTVSGKMSTSTGSSGSYTMSDFSSWGVPSDLSMKPEITAPGGNIYSVNGAVAGGQAYEVMSGTSMAAPQVAGMAALVAQYIRENGLKEKTGVSVRHLAQSLLTNHHSVVIIEPIEAQCRMLADSLDIPVICGDSISVDTLRTADVGSCNAFVAVTGSDEDNLVACQIAKREFGVDRTVARASNPKNRELLHTLGVDTVVCGTDNLSHILEREIETDTIRQLLSLGGGTASLNEILLPENFKFAGKAIMDVPIPGDAILVSITRDTEFIIPHGNTVLLPWDRILVLTQDDTLHLLTDAWELNSK